jgi:hypothetical protein
MLCNSANSFHCVSTFDKEINGGWRVHFTVILRGSDTYEADHSFGLAFIPCPVWIDGTRHVLNLNPDRPDYRMGSVKRLLEKEGLADKLGEFGVASIIVHPMGHGSIADLVMLQRDLGSLGFAVRVYGEIEANKSPFAPQEK